MAMERMRRAHTLHQSRGPRRSASAPRMRDGRRRWRSGVGGGGNLVAQSFELSLQRIHAGGHIWLMHEAEMAHADDLAFETLLAARDDGPLVLAQRLGDRLRADALWRLDGGDGVRGDGGVVVAFQAERACAGASEIGAALVAREDRLAAF